MRGARCATRDCQFRDRPREKGPSNFRRGRSLAVARGRASRREIVQTGLEPVTVAASDRSALRFTVLKSVCGSSVAADGRARREVNTISLPARLLPAVLLFCPVSVPAFALPSVLARVAVVRSRRRTIVIREIFRVRRLIDQQVVALPLSRTCQGHLWPSAPQLLFKGRADVDVAFTRFSLSRYPV